MNKKHVMPKRMLESRDVKLDVSRGSLQILFFMEMRSLSSFLITGMEFGIA